MQSRKSVSSEFKAALISIFLLTMDQVTHCNVTGVSHSDKPTYDPTWFSSALRSIFFFQLVVKDWLRECDKSGVHVKIILKIIATKR